MKAWLLLGGAIIMEVAGTTCMKLSAGFSQPLPSALIFVFYALSFVSLTLCLRRLDLATTYAIWSGLGTILITFIGIGLFGESMTVVKLLSILLIVIGVIGLNLAGYSN
jgi:small multidrug resistance pump